MPKVAKLNQNMCAVALHEDRKKLERRIRRIIQLRRNRAKFFDPILFSEPCWDMLLELYAASLTSRPVSVASLCCAASVPTTAGLRWIAALEEREVILRATNPFDLRQVEIALTPKALAAMERLFSDSFEIDGTEE